MEGDSFGNLSAEGLTYLDAVFTQLIYKEVYGIYPNFRQIYGELGLYKDILNGMDTTDSCCSNGFKINADATRQQYKSCSADSFPQYEQRKPEHRKTENEQKEGRFSNHCHNSNIHTAKYKESVDTSSHKEDESRCFGQFSKPRKKASKSSKNRSQYTKGCKEFTGCTAMSHDNPPPSVMCKNFNFYDHEYYLKCVALKEFLFRVSGLCWQKTKEITLLVLCLLLIVMVFVWRIFWFGLCFVFKLVLFVGLWMARSAMNCLSGATAKYDVIDKVKIFFAHGNDLVFLITGFNVKAIFTRSREQEPEYSCDGGNCLNAMPTTPEEAVIHLLQHEDKPFKALCVASESTNEEVKGNYRKLALLVHPDKCLESQANEAFKVLDSSFKTLMDPESRNKLMEEDRRRKEWEQFTQRYSNFEEDFETMFNDLLNSIACSKCEGKHRRTHVKDRTFYEARWCSDCNTKHSAFDGDVWAENSLFGFNWTCYVCMDGEIYELTEWAECQDLRSTIPVNSHRIMCRLGSQQATSGVSARKNRKHTESADSKRTRRQKRRQKGKKV